MLFTPGMCSGGFLWWDLLWNPFSFPHILWCPEPGWEACLPPCRRHSHPKEGPLSSALRHKLPYHIHQQFSPPLDPGAVAGYSGGLRWERWWFPPGIFPGMCSGGFLWWDLLWNPFSFTPLPTVRKASAPAAARYILPAPGPGVRPGPSCSPALFPMPPVPGRLRSFLPCSAARSRSHRYKKAANMPPSPAPGTIKCVGN